MLARFGKTVTSIRTVEGGGFVVRRPFPTKQFSNIDPFLMLDHLGPVTYGPGEAVGAPDHPHRGFETVTYVLQGALQHKDSAGNSGHIYPNDVQWMTAGKGVIHSEMPGDDIFKNGGTIEGFQIWINLPREKKMSAPRYQEIKKDQIPEVVTDEYKVRVIAGQFKGTSAVIDTVTPISFLDVTINRQGSSLDIDIPNDHRAFIYVYRGKGKFGGEALAQEGQCIEVNENTEVNENSLNSTATILSVTNEQPSTATEPELKFLLLSGRPIREPIARHGPFVMNTQAEIHEAFSDFANGRMGKIEGSEERYKQTQEALAVSGGPKHK